MGNDVVDEIISIHTLRMEGDVRNNLVCTSKIISIHTLRMEGDNGLHG